MVRLSTSARAAGNRVFAHVRGDIDSEADALTDKLRRIREIRLDGFEVGHLIHQHGLDEATAFEVEADEIAHADRPIGSREIIL